MKNVFSLIAFFPLIFFGSKKSPDSDKISENKKVSTFTNKSKPITYLAKRSFDRPSGMYTRRFATSNIIICSSSNWQYDLVYQTDGNLVLYKGTKALWSTGKYNLATELNFHSNGNLFLQTYGGNVWYDAQIGASGPDSFYWILQDDGNFVRYSTYDNYSVATGTANGKVSSHNGRIL